MDLEEAREVRESTIWALVCGEIDKRIADLHQQLVSIPPEKLVEFQQKLRTLAEFKKLPDDVINREEGV